jgi:hypothetical protein
MIWNVIQHLSDEARTVIGVFVDLKKFNLDAGEFLFGCFVHCFIWLEFLTAFECTIRGLVVIPLLIVAQLLSHSATQVQTHRTGKVTDADEGICEFDLDHLAVWEMVVHETLSVALAGFTDFAVDEKKLLSDGASGGW